MSLFPGAYSGCPMYSVSVTLCSSRGTLVLAHATLLVAIFAKRNVAQGGAAVVRLVVREGSWIVFLLIGQ